MKQRRWGVELTSGPAARSASAGCPVIRTARTEKAINAAVDEGYFPLIKAVEPDPDIHFMVGVCQDPDTGRISLARDVRWHDSNLVLGFREYYPYSFPNPFAAYLIPRGLGVGEKVWIDDLIEDVVAVHGNQGYHPRLACAPAVWNGTDLELLLDDVGIQQWVG